MPRILTCTDGSLYADSVYQYSAWAAKRMGASVHVLHMLDPLHEDPVNANLSGSIGLGAKTALMEEIVEFEANRARIAQKKGRAILEYAEQRLRELGLSAISTEQRHERLSDSIDQHEKDADLVVLGKRGNHADFERGHLGSNLERVIRSCRHPVLVASTAVWPMQRFVLAFDGGPSSLKAVDYAIRNPLLKGMGCQLVFAGKADTRLHQTIRESEAALAEAGFEVKADIRPGSPSDAIGAAIKEANADLLVMGAYGHSRIRELIVGSTTSTMIRNTKRPVLLFR